MWYVLYCPRSSRACRHTRCTLASELNHPTARRKPLGDSARYKVVPGDQNGMFNIVVRASGLSVRHAC